MSGLETVTSSVEDVLIDSLQFKPAPGASYLTAKRNTRWHASGSDTYSSNTGVRVLRFALTGAAQEWCDPQSLRIQFDVNAAGDADTSLKPLTGPWCMIQRVSVRVLGTLVEDITMYGRCYQQFFMGLTKSAPARDRPGLWWDGGSRRRGHDRAHRPEHSKDSYHEPLVWAL